MNDQQAREIARNAVERLVHDLGPDTEFPFDAVWNYARQEVPSTMRPHQANRLVREGYLERTGAMTRASTGPRAGSATPVFRPGSRFRPSPSPEATQAATSADVTVSGSLRDMESALAVKGLITTAAQLANFYLALKTSPLVILAGISGIGKSWLPRVFSELIGADFSAVQVQPQWSDNADLFGYTPTLTPEVFVPGRLTQALEHAAANPSRPTLVLLDEMNLALVEHYFSDFLSIIETRRREAGIVTTDRLPLDLPSPRSDGSDPYAHLRGIALPANVRVVGTANMDETTRTFSHRVLDRAFSLEFGDVDLTSFAVVASARTTSANLSILAQRLIDPTNPVSVTEAYLSSRPLFDCISGLLEEVKNILRPAGISFGYRTRDAICLYMWHWARDNLAEILPCQAAFDLCLLQKVLPKVSGTGEALRRSLEAFLQWLERDDANTPAAVTTFVAPSEDGHEVEVTDYEVGVATDTEGGAFPRGEIDDVVRTSTVGADSRERLVSDGQLVGICPKRPYPLSADKARRMIQRLDDESATTFWGT